MKKLSYSMPILLIFLLVFSAFSPVGAIDDPKEGKELADKVYQETPFIRDMDREIKMLEPASLEEAEEVYDETPFIKEASDGRGVDFAEYGVNAIALPYFFNFDFDSSLNSSTFDNGSSSTVRITALGEWEDPFFVGTSFDYYDVTLYVNGSSKGTYRFDTGTWQHADWTSVPSGATLRFVMTKHPNTYSGAQIPNGDISGSGEILNP